LVGYFTILRIGSTTHFFLQTGDHFKDLTVFSKNDVCLRDLLLAQTDVIDWKMYICLGTCISFASFFFTLV